ncbi:MAG: N-acetyltransferase [Methylococcaceae bacterium]|nr:N-acetyltransferase [Methylococcaceae bacterium]
MYVTQITSIKDIVADQWNTVAGMDYPFLRHEFLLALEQSGSISEQTGWQSRHLLIWQDQELIALMPLYLKGHSRGEYVFDQQWAQAFQQMGQSYYPKWLTAIPFTPCQGPRIAIKETVNQIQVMQLALTYIQDTATQPTISSWHCLFLLPQQKDQLESLGLAIREDVQFHWFNKEYRTFDDFLQTFSASKRKMIRRERRKVEEQGICLLQIAGKDVTEAQWRDFYQLYTLTYLKKGMQPYLQAAFFPTCAALMGEQLLLVLAIKDQQTVGAALSFVGKDTLYGRYWGCYEEFDFLHFEACYYQGLEYCIAHGLQQFDSGAQGEHKIARGFEPITTYSAHWLKDEHFSKAIRHFLDREQKQVALYKQEAARYLPFKK